ncbi:hypothetical protein [Microcella sp.]|uniref:hypothetical protein n=1 Tax=Microcella sp. TaxID=1913979 RepID=UPI003F71CF86
MTTLGASPTRMPSPGDRAAIGFFMASGVGIVVWAITAAVIRISAALSDSSISVLAEFAGTPAQAPIGPNGALVEIELDRAVLSTTELPTASLVSLVISDVLAATTITLVVACLLALSTAVLRGAIFSRRNTILVSTAGIAVLIGAASTLFFANMAANGAFVAISNGEFDNVVIAVDLLPYAIGAFVVALITTAFSVGERLQRETDGLV